MVHQRFCAASGFVADIVDEDIERISFDIPEQTTSKSHYIVAFFNVSHRSCGHDVCMQLRDANRYWHNDLCVRPFVMHGKYQLARKSRQKDTEKERRGEGGGTDGYGNANNGRCDAITNAQSI